MLESFNVNMKWFALIILEKKIFLCTEYKLYDLKNKRPMGHIAHLSNLGPCRNIICISFPFAPFDPRGPMI
jgi:hypothetical protein